MTDPAQDLSASGDGGLENAAELLPEVYNELRQLAAARLAHEKPGQTLQATALVHEVWLRIAGDHKRLWQNRANFFAAAAEAMRRILVENARRKLRIRHGGDLRRQELTDLPQSIGPKPETILAVDEAVAQLAEGDPDAAHIVKLHVFAGMTLDETAQLLGISRATVFRQWAYARATLRVLLQDGDGERES